MGPKLRYPTVIHKMTCCIEDASSHCRLSRIRMTHALNHTGNTHHMNQTKPYPYSKSSDMHLDLHLVTPALNQLAWIASSVECSARSPSQCRYQTRSARHLTLAYAHTTCAYRNRDVTAVTTINGHMRTCVETLCKVGQEQTAQDCIQRAVFGVTGIVGYQSFGLIEKYQVYCDLSVGKKAWCSRTQGVLSTACSARQAS